MPSGEIKILPGVDTNKTSVLNEGGVSQSNLVRLFPDRSGAGLVQKLGGWVAYYNSAISSKVRQLKGWADLNSNKYLGIGAQTSLSVLSNGTLLNVTPRYFDSNSTPSFSTTIGSTIVAVTDPNITTTTYDFVNFVTPISVGGITLYGPYAVLNVAGTTYQISATNAAGFLLPATATVVNGGAVPTFQVSSGSALITVVFNDHNLFAGDSFYVGISTAIGGVTLYGTYTVYQVLSANSFSFLAKNTATSNAGPTAMNSGNSAAHYYLGIGPSPTATGYGTGGYGVGGYGTGISPASTTGTTIIANDWTIGNWGEVMIVCPAGGPIYYWSPSVPPSNAQLVGPQSPLVNDSIFIAMPQRQIVALGSSYGLSQDPLLIRWCDVEDFSTWSATSTNQAGSYRIPFGSKIVSGGQFQQQGLIWTDLDLWSMQYIGTPYIYGFNQIGSNCGAVSRHCVGQLGSSVFWMSQKGFFSMEGGGPATLFCPVWDVIFQNINSGSDPTSGITYVQNIRCAVNSQFNEVTWYYPSSASSDGENDSYVKYNTILKQWDYGSLGRTAWIDQSVLGPPIGTGTDNYIYQHEVGNDSASGLTATAMASSFRTGYYELEEADKLIFIDQIWPDMKWGTYSGTKNANVNITFYGVNYPGDTPTVYGPYVMTQGVEYLTPRIRNRLLAIEISSDDIGTFWRLGGIRYRYQPDGKF